MLTAYLPEHGPAKQIALCRVVLANEAFTDSRPGENVTFPFRKPG
jgi:hypothetical protein